MAFTTGNDINILQSADLTGVGAGAGNDRYVLDASVLTAGQAITITDTQGTNTLQLTGGLVITSSSVANDALQLTLNNGSVITVLGASNFSFQTGGNSISGSGGTTQNYSTFVTASLGVAAGVPAAGAAPVTTGTVTINPNGGTGPVAPVGPVFSVAASSAVAEGASATFTVSLSAAQTTASTVTYTLAGTGGATLGTDTTAQPITGTLTFAAGVVTQTIVVPFTADAISPETGEGVSITLSAPSAGTVLSTSAATVTTAITDVPLFYTLTSNTASVFEGVAITYTLTASAASTTATTINFSVVPGDPVGPNQGTSNTNLNDFAVGAFNPTTVVLAAGATTATYVVTSASDTITELPENYSVRAVIGTTTVATVTTSLLDGTGAAAVTGTTFTLTTGSDTGPAFTGTPGNDTFVALAATTNPTFGASDVLNGGDGIDTLNLTIDISAINTVAAATTSAIEIINVRNVSGSTQAIAGGNFAGATSFVSDRSTQQIDLTGLVAGQTVGVVGNGAVANGVFNFTYGGTVTSGVINISGGTTAGDIVEAGAGITSNIINSTGAANTVGTITVSGTTDRTLTINAATPLTATSVAGLTAGATITIAGAATAASGVGVTLGLLASTVTTVNASGLTAGGVSATMNADTTLVITGGAGNDRITTGSVLTTGSVSAGAGTADRLSLAADTHVNTLALGNKYSGFEVVQIAAGGIQDLDLLITNNTLTGLRLAGTGTVTNVNAATAANVTILASSTPSIGVKGALTPGQIDTVGITVSDEAPAVSIITLTAPVLSGVEILNLVATDSITITTLANATALTNVNVSGAGNVIVTTLGTVALQTNYNINAGTATGNLTVDGTNATTNGFSLTGSSGVNTITGGSQVFSVNLAASTAKADTIALTSATGGTLVLPNAVISGFTNSATATVGDKLDLFNAPTVGAAVAATASTTDTTVVAALSATGIFTFSGAGAAAATLATKIAIASEGGFGGATQFRTTAFEHLGNTYIVENGDAIAGFTAGTDFVIQLTGVTGVTALSTGASAATTVFIA